MDFLDLDDEPDIATSDRQRIKEDDPRYGELLKYLKIILLQVETDWIELRGKIGLEETQKKLPPLKDWLDSLQYGFRKQAEQMIVQLSTIHLDLESDRKLLFRHGILAFERLKLRGSTDELVSNISNANKLLEILADRDALEVSLYRDIVNSRLEIIKMFQHLVDKNEKEKILQQCLFHNLWLLDPAWENVSSSRLMESRLISENIIVKDLSEKEKLGRVDIAYRTYAGKHIIVELKRASRKMDLMDLVRQGILYVNKLKQILIAQDETSPNIEVIFVLGIPVNEEQADPNRLKSLMQGISPGSRIVHYDSLINGARNSYAEYLEKTEYLDRVERFVNQLSNVP